MPTTTRPLPRRGIDHDAAGAPPVASPRWAGRAVVTTTTLAALAAVVAPAAAQEWSADDIVAGRQHWSFRRPVDHEPPPVRDTAWPRGAIDRFLLARMEAEDLAPVADADRTALIRRLAFDLTGLPPTPDEVRSFVDDTSADALDRVVEGYLASPRFGERWARHWLDVARYAESSGKESNLPFPHAWRYRDYCIDAFNDDLPFDRFVREQIAGDLLTFRDEADQARKIVATGFLALGPKGFADRDPRQFRLDLVDEQIDVVSQSMLGLTLACARCHDHAFDPVTQHDYYALAGIFLSTDTLYGTHAQQRNLHPSTLIELGPGAGLPAAVAALPAADLARLERRIADLNTAADDVEQRVMEERREGGNAVAGFVRVRAARDRTAVARVDRALFRDDGTPRTLVMGALERPVPVDSPLLARGELDQAGDLVPRGLVEVLCAADEPRAIATGSGRLDLAFWIGSRDNPLTARVFVNRVWLKLMGRGLVTTPDNFGAMGMEPSHPELLDHLAVSFMEDGWSVKRLIRRIVTSRAYGLAAAHDAANAQRDPDNVHRWRMDRRRLDAEAIRDAMLAVSGTLESRPFAGSLVARVQEDQFGMAQLLGQLQREPFRHRSIYLPIVRDQIPEFLSVFDFPDASLVSGTRDATNVPSQQLFLLNNAEAVRLAEAFADRVEGLDTDVPSRLDAAFELALSRPPRPEERSALRRFHEAFRSAGDEATGPADRRGFVAVCQALFASVEFRSLH
jgi:hypothetical protein